MDNKITLYKKINNHLLWLFLLNVADGILTYIGVMSGYAKEVNNLMVPIVTNPLKLFLFKILLPAILTIILSFKINTANKNQLMNSYKIITILLWIYLGVLFLHAIWIWVAVYTMFL